MLEQKVQDKWKGVYLVYGCIQCGTAFWKLAKEDSYMCKKCLTDFTKVCRFCGADIDHEKDGVCWQCGLERYRTEDRIDKLEKDYVKGVDYEE